MPPGGRRAGAGRKRLGPKPLGTFAVRIDREQVAALADLLGVPEGEAVRAAVASALEREQTTVAWFGRRGT